MIDTHCHICDPVFDADRQAVIDRARAAGVHGIVAVGESMQDARRNLSLSDRHPEIRPTAGLYPTFLDQDAAEKMRAFIRQNRDRLTAIGEVGLDYWAVQERADKTLQCEILIGFIDLAREIDLPLNVHSRSAGRHAVSLLIEKGARRVQMHAFDGKAGAAMPAVEAGYFFSIPPSVTRSRQKQKLVRSLPLSALLIETDSPVLGPNPEKRNEPANAVFVLETIAEIKNERPETVAEAVAENTRRLYGDG